MAITYDGENILDGDFRPRIVSHETSPINIINSLVPTREDGEVVISSNFGTKQIQITGRIKGTNQDDLEQNIDLFKGIVSRKGKNLDISYAGATRRYVCQPVSCNINRDFFHLTFAPFSVSFEVPDGYGKATSDTTFINVSNITSASQAVSTSTSLATFPVKGIHKITFTTVDNADFIRLTNTTTDAVIEVDLEGFSDTDYVEIDDENFTVKKNGTTDLVYRGKFPSVPGEFSSNLMLIQFKLEIFGSGTTLDQESTDQTDISKLYDDSGVVDALGAQSFICGRSGHVDKLSMFIGKTGNPTGSMAWLFREDDNNKPGTSITTTGYEIATASVPGAAAFTDVDNNAATVPYLHKGRRYWLKYTNGFTSVTGAGDYFEWGYSDDPTSYGDGKSMGKQSGNPATFWEDGVGDSDEDDGVIEGQFDYAFKIYMGNGGAAGWDVDWLFIGPKLYL